MNDMHNLSHTKRNCKYHIVFAQNTEGKYFMKKRGPKSKKNHKDVIPMERCGDNRGRNMPRSYTLVIEYIAKDEHIKFHGISQSKK